MIRPAPKNKTPSPEEAAIRSLIAGGPWRPYPDRDRFCELASSQGVAGLLYGTLREKSVPEIPERLKRAYYATAARNTLFLTALAGLETDLAKTNIRVIALKGAALLFTAYPDPGLRPMEDLDLLVRPEDQGPFYRALAGAGYAPHPDRGHLFSRGPVRLDVHTHALNTGRVPGRAGLFPSGMAPVLESAVPLGEAFSHLYRPCDTDLTLLLCQHALKHSYCRLIWLADIFRMLSRKDALFFRDLAQRAVALSQEKTLAFSLYLVSEIFSFRVPADLEVFLAGISGAERFLLDIKLSGKPFGLLGELLCFQALPRARDRVIFTAGVLFPREGPNDRFRPSLAYLIGRIKKDSALFLRHAMLLLRRIFGG